MPPQEWSHLTSDTRDIWEQNAAFWDDYMGDESNSFHRELVRPSTERLLEVQPGQQILDIACGNGNFTRHLAELGTHVVATDFSGTMIDRAKNRTIEHTDRITYKVVDATNVDALIALGENAFDAAVSNMALMDMATVEPLLNTLPRLLKPKGRFVFSIGHPLVQTPGAKKVAEEEDHDGDITTRYGINISAYITPAMHKGLAILGQPLPQHYFHRPLSVLFNQCFQAGFVIDGLEEPVFPPRTTASRTLSWTNFRELPPILVVRLRVQNP
jgi:SAM-dependent methyltransferase